MTGCYLLSGSREVAPALGKKMRLAAFMAAVVFCILGLAPLTVLAADEPPVVEAGAYMVMDAATGQILVGENVDTKMYPASITKIMTVALVLERVNYAEKHNELIETSDSAVKALIPRATMIALNEGELATLQDLMYATMIESANDAANVLAEYAGGSIDVFAELMNQKAVELGLTGSHFTNPSGQPDPEHYVTARDMGLILKWALTVPGFRELFSATEYAMGATNKQPQGRIFHNTNMALAPYSSYYTPGVVGSKSGYTDDAMYTLATVASRQDMELICVTLLNPYNASKYVSTNTLLDYCFTSFRRMSFPAEDIVTHSMPVFGGGEKSLGQIDVLGEGEATFLLHNNLSKTQVQLRYDVPERYVIGTPFAPKAIWYLPEDTTQQYAGELAEMPLTWQGLEQIINDHTGTSLLGRMEQQQPVLFWIIVVVPAALVALIAGRIVYVQHRRNKRRQRKLAAARAQMPIRIADRPEPPRGERSRSNYRRPSTPHLRVHNKQPERQEQPRRIGRAR